MVSSLHNNTHVNVKRFTTALSLYIIFGSYVYYSNMLMMLFKAKNDVR